MQSLRFSQVDVFSEKPMRGNPVAIVHCDAAPTDRSMQLTAKWLGLSETVFLMPPLDPRADYRVRIWTTLGELPFAGHPTLGACHAWVEGGGRPKGANVVQECGVGLITVRPQHGAGTGPLGEKFGIDEPSQRSYPASGRWAFRAPPLTNNEALAPQLLRQVCEGLGVCVEDVVDSAWVDNGAGWLALRLINAASVLSVVPDYSKLTGLAVGIIAPADDLALGETAVFESRAFIAGDAVPEDPATGSLQAGIGVWFSRKGVGSDRYLVMQGTALGKAGRISIERINGEIWVGGRTTTCIGGVISLDEAC